MKNRPTPLRVLLVGLVTLPLLLTGCASVQPWERGRLSDYTMRADRDPLHDMYMEHIYFTREAAAGGRSIGGGGCGCN
jgi:uncharacterized protein YceK